MPTDRGNRASAAFRFLLAAIVIDLWVGYTRLLIWWPAGGPMQNPLVRTQWARFIYEGVNGATNGTGNDADDWKPI